MFLNTSSNRFLADRKYEVLYPPTYGVYTGRLNYLKASGKFWSARVSDCIIAHKGKIFIGNGDYDKNTGACPICSYDPATNQWTVEGTLPTEHILNIREIDDTLWIPCQDHTGGNVDARVFRRKNDESWETISIPFPTKHSFDIAKYNNKIWVDVAQIPDSNKAAVAVSNDGGITWGKVQCYEANGSTLPNTTYSYSPNRIESGFVLVNDRLIAIDCLSDYAQENLVYRYDEGGNKFLRQNTNFCPPEVSDQYAEFQTKRAYRSVRPTRYSTGKNIVAFTKQLLLTGCRYKNRQFIKVRQWVSPNNGVGLAIGSDNYFRETYYSNKYVLFIPDGVEYMYSLLPNIGCYADGSKSSYVDNGDYRYNYKRDIVDVTEANGKLYMMQVSLNAFAYSQISTSTFLGNRNVPVTISIYSTTDNSNYVLEFESTFPTWPTCFTVLDGFAYICMGGDIHLESPWLGAVVKAKLNG